MSTPSPYHNKSNPLKAFVLGCDPTAFKDKVLVPLKTVFGIGQDGRYFAGIKANLKQLNIGMEDIYVQNLIPEYRLQESSKDPTGWINDAQQYIPDRIKEFDGIDPTRTIPVFLTSELLYKALLNEGQIPQKPIDIYSDKNDVFIHPAQNKLFRPLIILYRHPAYSLKNQKEYSARLLKYFGF
jgi:hypothetical protein